LDENFTQPPACFFLKEKNSESYPKSRASALDELLLCGHKSLSFDRSKSVINSIEVHNNLQESAVFCGNPQQPTLLVRAGGDILLAESPATPPPFQGGFRIQSY
jgi:hypothetical protein